jgi:hypothetical protein
VLRVQPLAHGQFAGGAVGAVGPGQRGDVGVVTPVDHVVIIDRGRLVTAAPLAELATSAQPGVVADPLCIPPDLPDLDCQDIEPEFKSFPVLPPDPHGFDGDNDGVGCEDDGQPTPAAPATPVMEEPDFTG